MEILKAIIFFLSLILTIFFIGKLFSWGVHEISNKGVNKVTANDINEANFCMFVACCGWTTLYYLYILNG